MTIAGNPVAASTAHVLADTVATEVVEPDTVAPDTVALEAAPICHSGIRSRFTVRLAHDTGRHGLPIGCAGAAGPVGSAVARAVAMFGGAEHGRGRGHRDRVRT